MSMGLYCAHSLPGRPREAWQLLEEHLGQVAERAGLFAKPFASEAWARLLGELHDLGKARQSFQSRALMAKRKC